MTTFNKYVPSNRVVGHTALIIISYLAHLIDSFLSSNSVAGGAFNLGLFDFVLVTLLFLSKILPFYGLVITGKKIYKYILLVTLAFGVLIAIPQLRDLSPSPVGVSIFDILNYFTAYIAIFDIAINTLIFFRTINLDDTKLN
jgi:hypothetical protein